ncbi:MAG: DNA-binding protein [Patescibacteria group bacterium]
MARPGVTYTEVSNAAKQLIATGRSPTVETVRIALGTGSNSTINTHLRDWKTRQTQIQNVATKENLPEELIATIKGLWNQVMDQAEEKILMIQQETGQNIEKLKQEVQQLQQENARWQQQCQQTKQERDGFAHEKSVVEQLVADAKIEVATLTEKHAGLEQQTREKQAHIDEMQRQNQQMQANLEHYRASALEQRLSDQQHHEQQQRQFEQTIRQINQELIETKRENTMLQQQNKQVYFERDSLETRLNKFEAQHESVTARLTETLNELAKKEEAQQHWQNQCGVLTTKFDEQNKSFVELQAKHATLLQQLETSSADIKEMRQQNKVLANEKWELGQEKARLYGQLKQVESIKLARA